jgi:hypothetical protein
MGKNERHSKDEEAIVFGSVQGSYPVQPSTSVAVVCSNKCKQSIYTSNKLYHHRHHLLAGTWATSSLLPVSFVH